MRVTWVVRVIALGLVVAGFVASLKTHVPDCDSFPCEQNRWDAVIGSIFVALLLLYLTRMFRRD